MIPRPLFTVVLMAAAGPLPAQLALDLTGKPSATIAEPFTKISGVRELSARLAVATDNMERKVVLIDFTSGSVKQIGSRGRGPNEYQYASPPFAAPSGAYVFDISQRRLLSIGPAGAISGTTQSPDDPSISQVRGSDASGRIYFQGNDFNPNTGGFSDTVPVVRWDPATNKVEPIFRVHGGGRVIGKRNGSVFSAAREGTPFPHMNAWAVMPDGRLAIVRQDTFRIEIVTPGGARTRGPVISYTPIPITAAEREWYRERNTPGRMSAGMVGGGSGPQQAGMQWEDSNFPTTFPPFIAEDVLSTPDGQLWIGRSFTSKDKTRRYDIYDGSAKLIGTATLKPNARIVGFGPRSVYVARVNPDDDLVYLDRYAR